MRDPILINTVGHSAGLLLFGLILILLVRDWRAHGVRQTKLSLAAAALALTWNAGALIALASHEPAVVVIVSFSALSLLPAVLLQVALQGKHPAIVVAGYIVSASAVVLHCGDLHQMAVVLIAAGFGLLTVVAFFLVRQEWISLGCLLLFTTSFLHFGYQHVSSPWAAEITWHHVGIPVVLIVLLQDYRFLLLDAFVRFLVNFGLAAAYIATLLLLNRKFLWLDAIRSSIFSIGITLVALCLSLILFVYLRNALQVWVGRVIFRRQRVENCVDAIVSLALKARSEEDLLLGAAAEVARHLRADQFAVPKESRGGATLEKPAVLFGAELSSRAQIPLRFSSGDVRFLVTGPRHGGRRYLSEDLEDMRRLGAAIVEQVERFRAEELRRLASEAELRALQAQINPHFLFNALNTLYGTIDRRSHEARRMVLNLADIFRYFLQGDRVTIQLSEELRIVEAYLEIEKLRLGDRLETELIVSESARAVMIPILSIQPLVENAVKHGIAAKAGHGRVCVTVSVSAPGLSVSVADTGVGFEESRKYPREGAGVGLENVRRRLTLFYGPAADLAIRSTADGTTVSFLIPSPVEAGMIPLAVTG
ncbi:MAG TPA: histidine kinase [Bryobacteraceae bacterium]|nr:histidine kinase [Bryobacteraceae bacterium]